MKKVKLENAVGMTLCHDITAMFDGFKGALFKRGHVIAQEDIPRLLDIGKQSVFVWEPEAGEIHEEDAALRMAAMAPCALAHYEGPGEGKMILRADAPGMFRIDTALLHEINRIGDITITTLPDHYPVTPGARLASMRIVPLVTQETQIAQAEQLCRSRALFRLLPYRKKTVGIIITGSEIYHGRIRDKFEAVARKKLAAYPCEILGVAVCDDVPEMLDAAARAFLEQGADLLIFSGGMSVDPDDLTPAAIRALGAEIVSYGVPAQPGNMTLVAYLGSVAILGVPGAAVALPTTIFDVVLPQIFAEEKFTKADLLRLAEGGLCQQCSGGCHFPNCSFGRY
ncbi:MAG: molybdopterin-binding protein [Ruminococcaceae bacterium]|nr:molybdopterin-binding protein [Oscillospiraceae bacterium]